MIKKIRFNRACGMFRNVNLLIDRLYRADKSNLKLIVQWGDCCYRDKSMKAKNCWSYYFKKVHKTGNVNQANLPLINNHAYKKNDIICPRHNGIIYLPDDRKLPNLYIEKYIKPKPHIIKIIEDFKSKYFNEEYIIGVHLRGAGRLDGGAKKLKKENNYGKNDIPFDLYFKEIDKKLEEKPNSKIFVCSDSQIVIDRCVNDYKDKVFTYDSTRSSFGEMHARHRKNKGLSFPKYKLGEDVLVEAYLLSNTNYFIHGCSNVSNFVICKNPELENYFVYEDTIKKIW